jgi:hypothetical protein
VPYPDELLDLGGEKDLGVDSMDLVTLPRCTGVAAVTFS